MFGKDGPTFVELVQQSLASTQRGYDMLAPKFDATPFRTPDAVLEPAIAAIGPCDSALDVCCGTGAAMHYLRPQCKTRVVGIDFSAGMLRKARENMATSTGSAEMQFIEDDVRTMAFENEFDVAVCFGALGHFIAKDQHTFLRRIHQALKPGGRFVFASVPHPPFFSRANLISRVFNVTMRIRNALIKPPFIMYYLTFLLPEVEVMLQQEGFKVEVKSGLFQPPFHRVCLVIATK